MIKSKFHLTIILIIGLLLACYVFYRSAHVSMTYDESYSYLYFQKSSIKDILLLKDSSGFSSRMLANNHIINTLLIKLSVLAFGNSQAAIRLPNFIFFLVFLLFSYKIAARFKNKIIIICTFILLTFNPFIIDIFSLARGYGISLGFMMVGIYYLLNYISKNKTQDSFKTIVFFGLATLSNFSFLYLYLSVFAIILFNYFFVTRGNVVKAFMQDNKKLLVYFVITFLIAFSYSIFLKEKDQLYYGGNANFWSDTIKSLVHFSLYFKKDQIIEGNNLLLFRLVQSFIAIVLAFSIIEIFITFKNRKYDQKSREFIATFLLFFLPSIASIVSFYLLDNKYLKDRTGVFLIPIFTLLFIHSVLLIKNRLKISAILILAAFSVLMMVNLIHSFNTNYYSRFDYTADVEDAALYIKENYNEDIKVAVRGNLFYEMLYYKERLGIDNLEIFKAEDLASENNIRLVFVDPYYYDTLKQYNIKINEKKVFEKYGSILYEVLN